MGMWECSATHSDSKPASSTSGASSVIEIAWSVGKIAIPNFTKLIVHHEAKEKGPERPALGTDSSPTCLEKPPATPMNRRRRSSALAMSPPGCSAWWWERHCRTSSTG